MSARVTPGECLTTGGHDGSPCSRCGWDRVVSTDEPVMLSRNSKGDRTMPESHLQKHAMHWDKYAQCYVYDILEEPPLPDELVQVPAEALANVKAIVSEQTEGGGVWFIAQTASEDYLQQELRRLHTAIEAICG